MKILARKKLINFKMTKWECQKCGLECTSKCVWERNVFKHYSKNILENAILKSVFSCKEEDMGVVEGFRTHNLKIEISHTVCDIENENADTNREEYYNDMLNMLIKNDALRKMYCKHDFALVDSEICEIDPDHKHPIKKSKQEIFIHEDK